jgi:putative ABC transport system substrate-binding protein
MDPQRRAFVVFLGGALATPSLLANAQQATRVRTVGVLMGIADDRETQARAKAIEQGLAKKGWIVGQNLHIEYRYAAGDLERMLSLSKEIVGLHPDVIIGHSTPVVAALLKTTRTIPIVFVAVGDPVGSGFVASIARPGGNITGFSVLQPSITG